MKAEDTVIEVFGLEKLTSDEIALVETQAEISFEAGIREVVEWMNNENTIKLKSLDGTREWFRHCGLLVTMEKWQAKLKDWEINED